MPDQPNQLHKIRHSLAHALAAAVLEYYPEAKPTIGPPTDNGFYYDFDFGDITITEDDLPKIEKKMREILNQWETFAGIEISPAEAKNIFSNNSYKLELIDEIENKGEPITIYYSGQLPAPSKEEILDSRFKIQSSRFLDLCRGGHVDDVQKEITLDAFKLDSIAGAYWRGDSNNPMLTRVYGSAFYTKDELDSYISARGEALKRDHKKIGKEMELFTFSPLVGSGLPLFMPKGMVVREAILDFITQLKTEKNYKFVWTPHLAKEDLYVTSGHLGKYDAMLPPIVTDDGEHFVMKPMNCPHHFQIFKATQHSYRDLPLRIAENATDYRNEKSGELNGLFRVRSLTQDDTHHFVRHDQIPAEIDMILDITRKVYEVFGFSDFRARISVRDKQNKDKYFGADELWDTAEKALISAVERWGAEYFIGEGEAAFYGPKIDIMVRDALNREWQLTTVQLDYVQPENFDMTYIDESGKPIRPAVLHAAILGSLDRFMGIIIEHFGGHFPLWLSPIQVAILPVSDKFDSDADNLTQKLSDSGIRAQFVQADQSLGKRIRQVHEQKIPYFAVIGEKEIDSGHYKLETSRENLNSMENLAIDNLVESLQELAKNFK